MKLAAFIILLSFIGSALAQMGGQSGIGIPGVWSKITIKQFMDAAEAYAVIDSVHVRVLTSDSTLVPPPDSSWVSASIDSLTTLHADIEDLEAGSIHARSISVDTIYGHSPITFMDTLDVPAMTLGGVTETAWPEVLDPFITTDLGNRELYWELIGGPDSLTWSNVLLADIGTSITAVWTKTVAGDDGYFYTAKSSGTHTTVYQHTPAGVVTLSSTTAQALYNYQSHLFIDCAYNNGKVAVATRASTTTVSLQVYTVATNSWSNEILEGVGSLAILASPTVTSVPDGTFLFTTAFGGNPPDSTIVREITVDSLGNIASTNSVAFASDLFRPTAVVWGGDYYVLGHTASGHVAFRSSSLSGLWTETVIGPIHTDSRSGYVYLVPGATSLSWVFSGRNGPTASHRIALHSTYSGVTWTAPVTIRSGSGSGEGRSLIVFDENSMILDFGTFYREWNGTSWSAGDISSIWNSTSYGKNGFRHDGEDYVFARDDTAPNNYAQWEMAPTPGKNTGFRDVSARFNTQNLMDTWITLIDPGGYDNDNSVAGAIWLGNPTGNDTVYTWNFFSGTLTSWVDDLTISSARNIVFEADSGSVSFSGLNIDSVGVITADSLDIGSAVDTLLFSGGDTLFVKGGVIQSFVPGP